jgi:hypothetical protein
MVEVQMAPQETQKLDELLGQLAEHRSDFRVFRTEILGGPEDDKPTGRLPMLEESNKNHEKRIRRIESGILMVLGAAALLKALGWGAEAAYHMVEVLR